MMTELDLIIAVLLFICCILLFLMILVRQKFEEALTKFSDQFVALEKRQGQTDQLIKFEITKNREETAGSARSAREELSKSLKDSSDSLLQRMTENAGMQKNQLDFFSRQLTELTHLNEEKLETIRKTVEHQLQNLQGDTRNKLEQMRATVDEKLHSTLEKRLGESFNQVSERLEQVYKGLAGIITVTDEHEQKLGLPSGEYDLPFVIQDRSFNKRNQLTYLRGMHGRMTGFLGDTILVNGRRMPSFQ